MELCHAPLKSNTSEPNLQHWSLENEAKCVIAQMPDVQLTCLDFWCKAGSSKERHGEEGLAHFLEHMVFKGSNTLKPGEFDLKVEALGGSSNAATGFDDVHFYVLVPSKEAIPALELLLELVLNPAIKEKEYFLEKEVVIEEIAQFKDQPEERIFQKLLENCWGKHQYGRPILGFKTSLNKMSSQQMKLFHKRNYTGENCCLSIAGNIPKGIEEFISNSRLSKLPKKSNNESSEGGRFILNFNRRRDIYHIKRLESARILMAWQMPGAKHQEILMGADIATSLLSEGRRSRLVQHLVEDLQIVESIEMDLTTLEQGSIVMLEACCAENKVALAEKQIKYILRESMSKLASSQEISRAQRLVSNGLCFGLEASSQVAGMAGAQALWNRKQNLLAPINFINSWTASRLQIEMFSKLQPELSCTLIAKPSEGSE